MRMSEETRVKILDHLHRHQAATAAELGRSLHMTGANIRHHLAILRQEGRIVPLSTRKEKKGRPTVVYGIAPKMQESGITELAEAMLAAWGQDSSLETGKTFLQALARNMAGENLEETPGHLSTKLGKLVERLNELHYQARWEAGPAGARVILGHCPYAGLIECHGELCQVDAAILENYLGLTPRQISKLEQTRSGLRRCVFLVG